MLFVWFNVLVLLTMQADLNDQNFMLQPDGTGKKITQAVIDKLTRSCVYFKYRAFLERWALVSTDFGLWKLPTYLGGLRSNIWGLSEAMFDSIPCKDFMCLSAPFDLHVETQIEVVSFDDLRRPLLEGLVAIWYLHTYHFNLSQDIKEQARVWAKHLLQSSNENVFVQRSLAYEYFCPINNTDVLIVLDKVDAFVPADQEQLRKFVEELTSVVLMDSMSRIAVTEFSSLLYSGASVQKHPSFSSRHKWYKRKWRRSYLSAALNYLTKELKLHSSPDRKVLVVLITISTSINRIETFHEARRLKDTAASVYVIGIGDYLDVEELKLIADKPTCKYLHIVKSVKDLMDIRYFIFGLLKREPKKLVNMHNIELIDNQSSQSFSISFHRKGAVLEVITHSEGLALLLSKNDSHPSIYVFDDVYYVCPGTPLRLYFSPTGSPETYYFTLRSLMSSSVGDGFIPMWINPFVGEGESNQIAIMKSCATTQSVTFRVSTFENCNTKMFGEKCQFICNCEGAGPPHSPCECDDKAFRESNVINATKPNRHRSSSANPTVDRKNSVSNRKKHIKHSFSFPRTANVEYTDSKHIGEFLQTPSSQNSLPQGWTDELLVSAVTEDYDQFYTIGTVRYLKTYSPLPEMQKKVLSADDGVIFKNEKYDVERYSKKVISSNYDFKKSVTGSDRLSEIKEEILSSADTIGKTAQKLYGSIAHEENRSNKEREVLSATEQFVKHSNRTHQPPTQEKLYEIIDFEPFTDEISKPPSKQEEFIVGMGNFIDSTNQMFVPTEQEISSDGYEPLAEKPSDSLKPEQTIFLVDYDFIGASERFNDIEKSENDDTSFIDKFGGISETFEPFIRKQEIGYATADRYEVSREIFEPTMRRKGVTSPIKTFDEVTTKQYPPIIDRLTAHGKNEGFKNTQGSSNNMNEHRYHTLFGKELPHSKKFDRFGHLISEQVSPRTRLKQAEKPLGDEIEYVDTAYNETVATKIVRANLETQMKKDRKSVHLSENDQHQMLSKESGIFRSSKKKDGSQIRLTDKVSKKFKSVRFSKTVREHGKDKIEHKKKYESVEMNRGFHRKVSWRKNDTFENMKHRLASQKKFSNQTKHVWKSSTKFGGKKFISPPASVKRAKESSRNNKTDVYITRKSVSESDTYVSLTQGPTYENISGRESYIYMAQKPVHVSIPDGVADICITQKPIHESTADGASNFYIAQKQIDESSADKDSITREFTYESASDRHSDVYIKQKLILGTDKDSDAFITEKAARTAVTNTIPNIHIKQKQIYENMSDRSSSTYTNQYESADEMSLYALTTAKFYTTSELPNTDKKDFNLILSEPLANVPSVNLTGVYNVSSENLETQGESTTRFPDRSKMSTVIKYWTNATFIANETLCDVFHKVVSFNETLIFSCPLGLVYTKGAVCREFSSAQLDKDTEYLKRCSDRINRKGSDFYRCPNSLYNITRHQISSRLRLIMYHARERRPGENIIDWFSSHGYRIVVHDPAHCHYFHQCVYSKNTAKFKYSVLKECPPGTILNNDWLICVTARDLYRFPSTHPDSSRNCDQILFDNV